MLGKNSRKGREKKYPVKGREKKYPVKGLCRIRDVHRG
jgi:hypothetical protein